MFLKLLSEPCLFKCSQFPYCDLKVAMGNSALSLDSGLRPRLMPTSVQHSQGQAELEGGSFKDFFWDNLSEAISQSTNFAEHLQCAVESRSLEGGFVTGW